MTSAQRTAHEQTIAHKFKTLSGELTERSSRLWAASEAMAIGYGGVRIVHRATGIDTRTIRAGLREAHNPALRAPDGRIRRMGGGRKKLTERDTTLTRDLESCLEPHERGDPESPLHFSPSCLVDLGLASMPLPETLTLPGRSVPK